MRYPKQWRIELVSREEWDPNLTTWAYWKAEKLRRPRQLLRAMWLVNPFGTVNKKQIGGEVMGATISASMKLEYSNCPLNLNTPHKASESYNDYEADVKQLLSGDCVERLLALQKAAERYVDGVRAQGNLFDDSTVTFTANGESVTVTGEQLDAAANALSH